MATTETTTHISNSQLLGLTYFPKEDEVEITFTTSGGSSAKKRLTAQEIFDWLYASKRLEYAREPYWDMSKPKPKATINDVSCSSDGEIHFGFNVGRNFGILTASIPEGEIRTMVLRTQRG